MKIKNETESLLVSHYTERILEENKTWKLYTHANQKDKMSKKKKIMSKKAHNSNKSRAAIHNP